MKKFFILLFVCIAAILALSSCDTIHGMHTCSGEELVALEPTCGAEGEKFIVCSTCYHVMDRTIIPATGDHIFGEKVYDEGDYKKCEPRNYTQHCTVCEQRITGYGAPSSHSYEKTETVYPTCTDEGYTVYTCKDCGYKNTNTLEKTAHQYGEEYQSDETHHWSFCQVCGEPGEKQMHTEGDNESCGTCGVWLESTPGTTYRISDDGTYAILASYSGESKTVRIAEEYQGVPVTHIGDNAFFRGAQRVILTKNITHIGESAFYGADVHTIENMDNVVYIGKSAFRTCYSLDLTELPKCLEYIGEEAFISCLSLRISYIPDSVTYIGSGAFFSCNSIEDITIGSGVECIPEYAFASCQSLGKVVMGGSVITVSDYAFEMSNIKEIVFSDATEIIGERAFLSCRMLESVHLGSGIKTIGYKAFSGCEKLKNITLSSKNENYCLLDSVLYTKNIDTLVLYPAASEREEFAIADGTVNIAAGAFSTASLSRVVIPDSVKVIGENAFINCSALTTVTMGKSVTDIGDGAFAYCYSLTDVTLPSSLATIGSSAFHSTSIKSITIPGGVHTISSGAFGNCQSLTSVTLCEGIAVIDVEAFYWAPIKEIVIPDSVEMIERRAFSGCKELTTIIIGKGVKVIETSAFFGCYNSDKYYKGSEADWKSITIQNRDFTEMDTSRLYFYSETKPNGEGKFWRYDASGNPVKW